MTGKAGLGGQTQLPTPIRDMARPARRIAYSPAVPPSIPYPGAAVNYYEQFGLTPNANPEEIHRAYRHLCRLLHPDQQQHQDLRSIAEAQMRWVNQVYETLRDPERRQAYDASLKAPARAPWYRRPHLLLGPLGWRTGVWYAGAALAVAAIAWHVSGAHSGVLPAPVVAEPIATRRVAPIPVAPPPVRAGRTLTRRSARPVESPAARRDAFTRPASRESLGRLDELAQPAAVSSDWGTPPLLPAAPPPLDRQPAALLTLAAPPRPPPRFAGIWYYIPERQDRVVGSRPHVMYPPQFIEAVVAEHGDSLQGRYRARYRVDNLPISPNVSFQFHGKISGTVAQLDWVGAGGASGIARLRVVSETSLEIQWTTTVMGEEPQLAGGRAVLVRGAQP